MLSMFFGCKSPTSPAGRQAVAQLPKGERLQWQRLWDDVAALVNDAAGGQ
jgi:hypothetical protein